jgi:hypothetical protein
MGVDTMRALGTMLGTCCAIVMDETTSMVRTAENLMLFYAHESCGFTMVIPARARREGQALPLVVFGHGVFGRGEEYLTGGIGTDLIQPLRSRCLHLELETISPIILVHHFSSQYPDISYSNASIAMFMSLAKTPTELKNTTRILCAINGGAKKQIEGDDIISLFAAPSFSLCLDLLRAYIRRDEESMKHIFLDIWMTGISYEDFLYELTSSIHQLGIIPPKISQDIHQLILKGWILFAQGKTHTLDVMRLFFHIE